MASSPNSFTGYQRQRITRLSVRLGELVSRLLITGGGIGTILAIILVCFFLIWVAVPLFFGADVQPQAQQTISWPPQPPWQLGVDPDQKLGWTILQDGQLVAFRYDTGAEVFRQPLFPGQTITAASAPSRRDEIVLGFQDGSLRVGRMRVLVRQLTGEHIPPPWRALPPNDSLVHEGSLVHRDANGVMRTYQLKAEWEPPITPAKPSPVLLVDFSMRSSGPLIGYLTGDGILHAQETTVRENYLTGETVRELSGGEMPLASQMEKSKPRHLLVNGVGDNIYLAWEDGRLIRVHIANLQKPYIAEEVRLVDGDAKLTAFQFMIGKSTLLTGDSTGRVRGWFRIRPANFDRGDRTQLVAAHELPRGSTAVSALAASARSRVMAAGYADGSIGLYYFTNEKNLAHVRVPTAGSDHRAVDTLYLTPKEDGLFALSGASLATWMLNPGHPEASFRSLILPVWYEGYPGPAHVWQSSSGDDAFEPKLGLWPLIFGTLKATFYSLLMGVPLALLAAVYTREFLHPRVRSVVKPTIEVMASLPSVVLGFLAALVVAPFVEDVLPVILTGVIIVPATFVLGGFLWHLFSTKFQRRFAGWRFGFLLAIFPLGIFLASALAPLWEQWLFRGNLKAWLNGNEPPVISGWLLLLLPLSALGTTLFFAEVINPLVRRWTQRMSVARAGYVHFGKFLLGLIFTVALALALSALLTAVGWDARGSLLGTYVQRNAMIVGFMMGFAIIPIIYTIADDALAAVPDHLRSASLGCGATPWQTASRIIIPTAMSGLFSAMMVGLGRAVGETMIVLMAAGNTPLLEMNIFNGFRTLSANIAVELPEAVKDSTHYRTLFLAALVLFAMTFVLNTLAEAMRQRFRRRAFEL